MTHLFVGKLKSVHHCSLLAHGKDLYSGCGINDIVISMFQFHSNLFVDYSVVGGWSLRARILLHITSNHRPCSSTCAFRHVGHKNCF